MSFSFFDLGFCTLDNWYYLLQTILKSISFNWLQFFSTMSAKISEKMQSSWLLTLSLRLYLAKRLIRFETATFKLWAN